MNEINSLVFKAFTNLASIYAIIIVSVRARHRMIGVLNCLHCNVCLAHISIMIAITYVPVNKSTVFSDFQDPSLPVIVMK